CNNEPIMYFDPSGHTRVTVTLPNGSTQTANVNSSGHTIMNNGSRPPAGSTVTFPNGNTYSVVSNPSGAGGVSGVRLPSSSGSSGSGSSGGSGGGSGGSSGGGGLGGVNFGPNQGADWLRTGSGLSFEAFWGVTPFGMAFSNQATSSSMVRPPSGGTNMPTVQGISFQQAQSNIQSAFNALQGGFLSFAQFSDNVALNLSMTGLSGDALHQAMSLAIGFQKNSNLMVSLSTVSHEHTSWLLNVVAQTHNFEISQTTDTPILTHLMELERALAYLRTSPTGAALIQQLMDAPYSITIAFTNSGPVNYNHLTRTINWNPTAGLRLTDNRIMSPAMALAHEMGHAMQHLEGLFDENTRLTDAFIAEIERDNLRRFETPIARELGEFWRSEYSHGLRLHHGLSNSTDWGHMVATHTFWQSAHPRHWNQPTRVYESLSTWTWR
ncbi:MAG: type III secretion system effector protein, partial [Clostridiales bacterium]|nr:type III secretion system effector protein [Clostridiales bacterium]